MKKIQKLNEEFPVILGVSRKEIGNGLDSVGSLVELIDVSAAPDVCVEYITCGEYNGCDNVSVCRRFEN